MSQIKSLQFSDDGAAGAGLPHAPQLEYYKIPLRKKAVKGYSATPADNFAGKAGFNKRITSGFVVKESAFQTGIRGKKSVIGVARGGAEFDFFVGDVQYV